MATAMGTVLDMRDALMEKNEAEATATAKTRKVDRDQRRPWGFPLSKNPG